MSTDHHKRLEAALTRIYASISRRPSRSYYESQLRNWRDEIVSHELIAAQLLQQLQKWTSSKTYCRILDVGCGTGDLVLAFAKNTSATGIDIDHQFIKAAKLKAVYLRRKKARFFVARAENLPFPDNYFDLVVCKTTLEHVNDVEKAISEMVRVLKPGGWMYIEAPNYFWIWEGHYGLFMFPLLPKSLFKLYARLVGKDPAFIQYINYLTPWQLEHLMKKFGLWFKNLSPERYRRIMTHPEELSKDSKPRHFWLLRILSRIGLSQLLSALMLSLKFYPSLIYLAQKPKGAN
ncbi:MAG: methyltransferase domain-containing protein [Candidatus Micrarchaeia archaeon]